MRKKKESSSLSVNSRFLIGVLTIQIAGQAAATDLVRPFPVLGSVSVREGHWNDAADYLSGLPDKVREDALRFSLLATAAEQYFSQNLLSESQKLFSRLSKARKPSPSQYLHQNAILRLAEINLLTGRTDEAMAQLDPLIQDANPYIAEEAIFIKARCYLQKRDYAAMAQAVAYLIKRNPAFASDLPVNLMRAVAALEQNKPDEALVYLKKYPEEPSALYYSGIAHIRKREPSNALPLYQKLLQIDTSFEWLDRMRLTLGEWFYSGNDYNQAHAFFKPVTRPQADPTLRPLALHRRACIFFQQENYVEAEKIFTDLLKQYPKHELRSQWTYLYASIPVFKKDWKKAIQEQKMALEFDRGLAPRLYGADEKQLRLSADFRILWAHLLLNNYNGVRILADKFIARYPNEQMTSYAYLAKGMSAYRMGEYDRALEIYQELLNKFPDSSACGKAVYLMVLGLHSSRDPFRMAGVLNEVHSRMSKATDSKVDEWTQNTLYWVADGYFQLNDFQSSEKIFKEFILRTPQSALVPYALEELGAALSAQGPGRDGEAIVALQQAQLRAKELGYKDFAEQVQLELGKIYYNQRDFAKAAGTWDNLVQVSTQTDVRAEALYRSGDALARQDYHTEAIKKWRLIAHQFKTSTWAPEAMMRIGTTQAGLGNWNEATGAFKTLRQAFPGTEAAKEAWFHMVQSSFNAGQIREAIVELLAFSKQYGDDARIPKAADNLLSAINQRKVAIPADQQASLLKLAPGSAGGAALLWERGAALFNEGKYEPSQKLFEKIMLSYPNDEYAPLAYFYNADSFFWLQKWDDAANAYQNFFVSFPKHERVPNAMFQKAVCLFRKGAYDDAVSDFKAFLAKFPKHPLSKEAYLNIALSHKKAFQLDKAVASYRFVLQNFPEDPKVNAVWLQMASLLEVQGKYEEAARTYAKVPPGVPEHPEALYRQAILAEQRRKPAEGRKLLEDLRALPDKKNEYRLAALVKLSEYYEQEGAPVAKLKALYQDIQASSPDPEIAKQAGLRLKELK